MDHQNIFRITERDVRLNVVLGDSGQLYVSENGITLGVSVKVKE